MHLWNFCLNSVDTIKLLFLKYYNDLFFISKYYDLRKFVEEEH